MNTNFPTALRAAESPIDQLVQVGNQAIARMTDECGEFPEIAHGHIETLTGACVEAISDGRFEFAYAAIDRFVNDVRAQLIYERAHGRLKVRNITDRVKERLSDFSKFAWGGAEKSTLIDMERGDGD